MRQHSGMHGARVGAHRVVLVGGSGFALSPDMLTILIIVLLIALLGGGLGYSRFGAAGMSPAALIVLILVIMALTGRL